VRELLRIGPRLVAFDPAEVLAPAFAGILRYHPGMNPRAYSGVSVHELRSPGISGVLSVEPGEGDFVVVEFTPSRPQLRFFRTMARRGDLLSKVLEHLGVPAAYHPKILASSSTWSRELTILPSAPYLKIFRGK